MDDPFAVSEYSIENPAKVLTYMYLSSYDPANDLQTLDSLKITHILNASTFVNSNTHERITYCAIPIADSTTLNIQKPITQACKFIEAARDSNGVVLVHCQAGVSRSATLVLAYLMKKYHFSLKEAITYLKRRKPNVAPNQGFLKQLCQLEVSLGKESSVDLASYLAEEILDVIPHLPLEEVKSALVEKDFNVTSAVMMLMRRYPNS